MKLGIIGGAGRLGATAAFCVGLKDCVDEIKLMDIKENMVKANVIDMTQAFLPVSRTKVSYAAAYEDFADCEIILNTAAQPYTKEITDRAQELRINADLVAPIAAELKRCCSPDTVLIVTANPVDVYVYMYEKLLGWGSGKILGLGVNDTVRLKWATELITGREYRNLNAVCVGEHGSNTVRLLDSITYGGLPFVLSEEEKKQIEAACDGWFGKWVALETGTTTGYTSAVTLSLMVEAIAGDTKRVMPCSSTMCAQVGFPGVSIGMPLRLGSGGAQEVILPPLNERERAALDISSMKVRTMLSELGY